jgi:nitrogen fixation protein NifU and related proteins
MSDELQQPSSSGSSNQPKNLGEMENADAVGTMGSADCGDMLRMWIKFRDEDGRKVIDKATFQTFGCETAIAVASLATELIKGKTPAEALAMDGAALSAPLGPLPPMKIHCAQLVEGALRQALGAGATPAAPIKETPASPQARTLMDSFAGGGPARTGAKIILKPPQKLPATGEHA